MGKQVAGEKPYNHANNLKKLAINKRFVAKAVKFMGFRTKVMYLDAAEGITTRTLINAGFDANNLCAPNINEDVCNTLTELGITSPCTTIEKCMSYCHILFNDTMTILEGNIGQGYWPMVPVDRILLQNNMVVGARCMVAVIVGTRNRKALPKSQTNRINLDHQMRNLAAMRGFVINKYYSGIYKKKSNMLYAEMRLTYNPNRAGSHVRLLMNGRSRTHVKGFPPNYVF